MEDAWALLGQVDHLSAATCQPYSREQTPSHPVTKVLKNKML